jgi:malonyl CoA-acyl carrier protein transacylase
MGELQIDNIVGGQLLYPVWDGDWHENAEYLEAISSALEAAAQAGGRAEWSIRLGGTAVLGADAEGLRALEASLPAVQRGERSFPLRLPLHSAFHTSLMDETSRRASAALAHLPFAAPEVPLIDGRGYVHRPNWADPEALRRYTLTTQVTETYDFSRALHTALNHCAPDLVVCLGPGNAMGGPVAQLLVQTGWRGIRGRDGLEAVQSDQPILAAFGVPGQAALLRA